jgi:hypothetical protein
MSASCLTVAGRRAAAALMVDACTISRPDAEGALNETTGQRTPSAGAQVYAGSCRVKVQATADRVVEAAERPVSLRTYDVSVPITVTDVHVDDVLRITASVLDQALVGLRLRVVDVAKGTHLTARRLVCEEQS